MKHAAVILCCVSVTACANQAATRSGFLSTYDNLQSVPKDRKGTMGVVALKRPDGQLLARYNAALIRPPVVTASDLADDQKAQLADILAVALRTEIAKNWTISSQPADRTLEIRTAITAVTKSNVALNVVTSAAVGMPLSNGGLSAEAEIVDSRTGKSVAAVTWANDKKLSSVLGYYSQTGHARALLPEFATQVSALISR